MFTEHILSNQTDSFVLLLGCTGALILQVLAYLTWTAIRYTSEPVAE
jgi:hypothetical protein